MQKQQNFNIFLKIKKFIIELNNLKLNIKFYFKL